MPSDRFGSPELQPRGDRSMGTLPPPPTGEAEEDRISGLPDELLHTILLRLDHSIRAAARTSVLSRRWRHVWSGLPILDLGGHDDAPPPERFPDSVDAVLAAYSAPTVQRLCITLPDHFPLIPTRRIAPWLLFASQRVVGSFGLFAPSLVRWYLTRGVDGDKEELELPAFAGATAISLGLPLQWRLRLRPACLFKALISLDINCGSIEGSELTALVSTQCPRLRKLRLFTTLFVDVGRRLQQLEISRTCIVAPLMQRFDKVDYLKLQISIAQGITGYGSFLNATNKMPKCETLWVYLKWNHHGFVPVMLQLLRNCNGTKKFSALLSDFGDPSLRYSCPSSCPCRLANNNRTDNIALDSLEEVTISSFTGSNEEVEFVDQLSRCNVTNLKKLAIYYTRSDAPPLTKELYGWCVRFN
ncbi:hypothetical protein ACP70R_005670 [Stipagrostis hirtigluma subsp. patula]